MSDRIGLIAGWGRFPVIVARHLVQRGHRVYCLGIHGHADPILAEICSDYRPVGLTRMGAHVRYFRQHGIRHATMAGKIFKRLMFQRYYWLKLFPDLTFLRFFYPHFLSGSRDNRDDSLLLTATRGFAHFGIEFLPATDFAPELLVKNGILTERPLADGVTRDIQFAWQIAKGIGGLDIGQSVAVKNQTVLAVEAVEGTDECIRRAGQLCTAGGFTVVKVAKPNQDMRFDVPTIGVGTLKTMRDAGGKVLAVEADKTIILDQPELIAYANRHGISVVALDESSATDRQFAA